MENQFKEIDAKCGVLVVLTVDVVDKNKTFKKGDICNIFWIGADKDNQKDVRLGLKTKADCKTFYCSASAVERYVKYPTAPFQIGDRVNYRGTNGTVFFVRQQEEHNEKRRHQGKWKTVIEGAIGDWLIGVNWESQCTSDRFIPVKLSKFSFADFNNLVKYKVQED